MTSNQPWFEALWDDYSAMAPRVSAIKSRLEDRRESVLNDHIAFRTFDLDPVSLKNLGPVIESLGYRPFGTYRFEAKKVRAVAYVSSEPNAPRIFLSELETAAFDDEIQELIRDLVGQAKGLPVGPEVFLSGRPWSLTTATYRRLAEVSEYAAWVAALGLRPNHFTVNVNALSTFEGLPDLLDFVEALGFRLNESGGRIKGTPAQYLEQGATLADRLVVEFMDAALEVPTCYYEFAYRHMMADGRLFDGFVEASADKIFESTNVG